MTAQESIQSSPGVHFIFIFQYLLRHIGYISQVLVEHIYLLVSLMLRGLGQKQAYRGPLPHLDWFIK